MEPGTCDKKQAIFRTALKLFSEQGFHDAPMALLASRAGVGVGTIYRYFIDKNGLIQALFEEVEETLHQAIIAGADPTLPIQQQFKHLIRNLIHYLHRQPEVYKFLEQYYHSPFGIEKKRENMLFELPERRKNSLLHILAGGGASSLKPLPLPVLHALALGPVLYLLRDAQSGLVEINDTVVQMVTDGCWEAIRADHPQS